eukprot:8341022-Pyramimonas_sp.AAC.1
MNTRHVDSSGPVARCSLGPHTGPDGICTRSGLRCLDRAAWAVCWFFMEEELEVVMSGPVVFPLPQTPQAAEHIGFLVLQQMLTQEPTAHADCKAVLGGFHKPFAARLSYRNMYSGTFRTALG